MSSSDTRMGWDPFSLPDAGGSHGSVQYVQTGRCWLCVELSVAGLPRVPQRVGSGDGRERHHHPTLDAVGDPLAVAPLQAVDSPAHSPAPTRVSIRATLRWRSTSPPICWPLNPTARVASSCIVTINAMGWQKRIAQTIRRMRTMSLLRGSHSRSCMRPWLTKQSCMPLRFAKTLNRPPPYSRIHDILE